MSSKVLVLNQDYSAFNICSVPKAFLLVYLNKAELVTQAEDQFLRSISQCYFYPVVIRLHKYVHRPYKGVVMTRQNIFKRDRSTCQYCGAKDHLTLDHVIPKSKGGKSNWDNLVTACQRCNAQKGDLSPEESGMSLKQSPFKPTFLMFIRDFSGSSNENWLPYLGAR
ncbi:HNH endonuclease [Ravibacter arvi]|uniref:HNH endonuclease n=1 Tax=Ravibacter arvi TaxID=2051041 RepID=A0ABP8MCY1_9BACT